MFILYRMKKENAIIHFTSGSFPEMFSENTKNKPELFLLSAMHHDAG